MVEPRQEGPAVGAATHVLRQICRPERVANHALQVRCKRNRAQLHIHPGAANHVLHRVRVGGVIALFHEKRLRELRAPAHMRDGVFRPGSLDILRAFEVASIMHENGQEPQFEHLGRENGSRPCEMPPAQQPGQAEGPL